MVLRGSGPSQYGSLEEPDGLLIVGRPPGSYVGTATYDGTAILAIHESELENATERRERLVTVGRLGAVTVFIVAWVGSASSADFYLLGEPQPGVPPVFMRLGEVAALWVASWVCLGWHAALKRRTNVTRTDVVIVSALPILVGLAASSWHLQSVFSERVSPLLWRIKLSLAVFPTGIGLLGAAFFMIQVWALRRYISLQLPRCRSCSYDLTGNVSGICPECGTTVVPTPEEKARQRQKRIVLIVVSGLALSVWGLLTTQWSAEPFWTGENIRSVALITGGLLYILIGGLQFHRAD